jgi:hypothetical protein
VLAKDATQKGWRSRLISYKGIAVWNTQRATSVYLAYPKLSYLIEVFDPSAANALKVALSGEMEPVRASEVVRVLSVTKSTN